MADNTTVTGGDVVASDDIGGVKYQVVKVAHGVDGSATHVSTASPLPVTETDAAIASVVNATTTNLAGGATFTGTSEDVHDYAQISVNIYSSHVSATDGLSLQQSSDGVNWDLADVFTLPAASGKTFSIGVQARYFRLVFTNGATLTTSLRIQTIFSKMYKKGSSIRPQDARPNENDFEEVMAYLGAFNGTNWDRVRSSLKNIQGAFALMTHDMKDTGRNARAFMLDVYTVAPVAEALQTVVQWYSNAAVAGTTTPAVVPAGKTLRLTSWAISTKSLATVGSAVLRIRANTAGVAVIGSPLVWSAEVGSRAGATTVAMTGGLDQQTGTFPEGFEFPAGTGLGFTLAGYGPAGVLAAQGVTRFQVYGYEY